MITIDTDQLLKAFLESDSAHWVHEPAMPPIERDAMYKCRLNVAGASVTYEVLVYRASFNRDDMERKIVLSYALSEKPWFGDRLLERNVELCGTGLNIASLTWPETDDVVIAKVAEIAKVAPIVSVAPSESIN